MSYYLIIVELVMKCQIPLFQICIICRTNSCSSIPVGLFIVEPFLVDIKTVEAILVDINNVELIIPKEIMCRP